MVQIKEETALPVLCIRAKAECPNSPEKLFVDPEKGDACMYKQIHSTTLSKSFARNFQLCKKRKLQYNQSIYCLHLHLCHETPKFACTYRIDER